MILNILGLTGITICFFFYTLFIIACVWSSLLQHRLFSSWGQQGRLLVAVCRLLIVVASHVVRHRLKGAWAAIVVAQGL